MRWSALFFALGFILPALLRTTMQIPFVREQIPLIFSPLLPIFVVLMFLVETLAFVFLYVALVYIDIWPEMSEGLQPVISPFPMLSANGNYVPGFISIGGAFVIGYPWAASAWLWVVERLRRRDHW